MSFRCVPDITGRSLAVARLIVLSSWVAKHEVRRSAAGSLSRSMFLRSWEIRSHGLQKGLMTSDCLTQVTRRLHGQLYAVFVQHQWICEKRINVSSSEFAV